MGVEEALRRPSAEDVSVGVFGDVDKERSVGRSVERATVAVGRASESRRFGRPSSASEAVAAEMFAMAVQQRARNGHVHYMSQVGHTIRLLTCRTRFFMKGKVFLLHAESSVLVQCRCHKLDSFLLQGARMSSAQFSSSKCLTNVTLY